MTSVLHVTQWSGSRHTSRRDLGHVAKLRESAILPQRGVDLPDGFLGRPAAISDGVLLGFLPFWGLVRVVDFGRFLSAGWASSIAVLGVLAAIAAALRESRCGLTKPHCCIYACILQLLPHIG